MTYRDMVVILPLEQETVHIYQTNQNTRILGKHFIPVVECLVMVRWVVRFSHHGGPIQLFLFPASSPQLV